MEQILIKMRKLNWLLQKTAEGRIPFDEVSEILSRLMLSNAYLVGRNGKILGAYYIVAQDSAAIKDPQTGKFCVKEETSEKLMQIQETLVNATGEVADEIFPYDKSAFGKYTMIVPVYGGGRRIGTLIFSRRDNEYTIEDVIIAEHSAGIVGIDLERRQNRLIENEIRMKAVVQLALVTLSYTEIEAVKQTFDEIAGDEGLVIAAKMAQKTGINRSVILNALRKLDGAGVIESKSLGMKGTHIKILNPHLKKELINVEMLKSAYFD